MTETIRGSCLCSAVQFELTPPSKFCAHCHCTMCRRAHAAPVVTWTGVLESQFRLTAGENVLGRHASSPEAVRSFCTVCGTPLLFQSSRWPGEVHVATAALLDPPDKQPSLHVFWDDRARWHALDDGLPKYGGTTGMEPCTDGKLR